MRLSLIDAAEHHHLAPKTLKAWHRAGLISALEVGVPGKPWAFDAETLDREIAALPRCAYRKFDDSTQLTVRCGRPVGEAGTGCRTHRFAVAGNKPSPELVAELARRNRKFDDGEFHCDDCGGLLTERKGWRIAKRRAESDDGVLRCRSCAATHRHQTKPYSKGRWRACPSCGGGPDWWTPWQEANLTHCARCFQSAPDVREKRREARLEFLATPEGQAAHATALHGAQAVHGASTAALPAVGLVPAKQAAAIVAPLIGYSPSTVLQSLKTERLEPNGLPRLGVHPRDVLDVNVSGTTLDAATRKRLGGQLAKLQSVHNGTEFGKPSIDKQRPGTTARILELHESGSSYREIADELGVSKSHVGDVIKAQKMQQSAAVQIP